MADVWLPEPPLPSYVPLVQTHPVSPSYVPLVQTHPVSPSYVPLVPPTVHPVFQQPNLFVTPQYYEALLEQVTFRRNFHSSGVPHPLNMGVHLLEAPQVLAQIGIQTTIRRNRHHHRKRRGRKKG